MRLRASDSGQKPAFWSALGLALLIHVALFGLIGIDLKSPITSSGMDVVLLAPAPLDRRPDEAPINEAADFLSNRSQTAGTDAPSARTSEAKATPPMNEAADPVAQTQPSDLPSLEDENASVRERALDLTGFNDNRANSDWSNRANPLQSDPRHKFIHASTREHAYAAYMDAWVKKIERVGKLHYPQLARRQGLSGELVLSVELLASGEVADMRIERSSGKPLLDQAALDIVSLASPYAPLPTTDEDIERLTITRTWQFSSGGAFR